MNTMTKILPFGRTNNYLNMAEESLAQMFEYKNFPETVQTRMIPIYLMHEGMCAFWHVVGNDGTDYGFQVTHCQLGGKPYPDGWGSIAICRCDNGIVKEFDDWRNSREVVVGFNNRTATPDDYIGWYCDTLAQIDVSINYNIKYSRYMPMPVARDDKEKAMINQGLKNMADGVMETIVGGNYLQDILSDGKANDIPLLNLTDVTQVDRIQYLSRLHEDLLRRIYGYFGMSAGGTGKVAQETVAEANNGNGQSMIIPMGRRAEMQRTAELLNDYFGWNVDIEFSAPWKLQFGTYYTAMVTNENIELPADDVEELGVEVTEVSEDENSESVENTDTDATDEDSSKSSTDNDESDAD